MVCQSCSSVSADIITLGNIRVLVRVRGERRGRGREGGGIHYVKVVCHSCSSIGHADINDSG